MVSLNLFFTICINLINNNLFHNNIFIYYRNNHKCNIGTIIVINMNLNIQFLFIIGTIINHKYKFYSTKMKKKKNSQKFKRQVNKNIHFLIKVIYNIL